MYLRNAKLTELQNTKFDYVLIPFGATEQHGPFLPYGTDMIIAEHMAAALDGENALILPGIPYTCSQEHEGFPGTVWIDYKMFMSHLEQICNCIAPLTKNILLMSGHGGNTEVLSLFRVDWNYKHPECKITFLEGFTEATHRVEMELLEGKVDSHAGNGEISILYYLEPDLVTLPTGSEPKEKYVSVFGKHRVKEFYEEGILDKNPNWKVSKEIGQKLFEQIVSELKAQVQAVLTS